MGLELAANGCHRLSNLAARNASYVGTVFPGAIAEERDALGGRERACAAVGAGYQIGYSHAARARDPLENLGARVAHRALHQSRTARGAPALSSRVGAPAEAGGGSLRIRCPRTNGRWASRASRCAAVRRARLPNVHAPMRMASRSGADPLAFTAAARK